MRHVPSAKNFCPSVRRITIHDFKKRKQAQQKICFLTCYDYPSARILADSHVDCVLIGDSVAMVVHGHPNTMMATMEMMVLHTQAVARGLTHQWIVSDLPFLCHRSSIEDTIKNVRQLLQAGAQAIKIEGGDDDTCRTIRHLVNAGIPTMGHIGLTPQTALHLGGYKIQGVTQEAQNRLLSEAKALEASGCHALVLECIPGTLAKTITETLNIPTIGIGAGVHTNGQVLVWHDMLALQNELKPRFVKPFLSGSDLILQAINEYAQAVHQAEFPQQEHTF
jgi:3-methyl-2-oxobutanoate hydroxymethyltransferase